MLALKLFGERARGHGRSPGPARQANAPCGRKSCAIRVEKGEKDYIGTSPSKSRGLDMDSLSYKKNSRAAIEGLPLYLLIIIIITAVSIGIVMGLLNMAKPPQTLGAVTYAPQLVAVSYSNASGNYENNSFSVTVTVTDGSGNRLSGAVVTLTGNNIKDSTDKNPYLTTDSNGQAKFSGLKCSVVGTSSSPITITVEKGGFGKKTLDLPVVMA